MTFINSTPTSTNNKTRPETVAERHRVAYSRSALPTHSAWSLSLLWVKLRPWLIGTIAGLLIGGAVIGYASYQVMPVKATHLERVFLTIDGRNAFLVSGDVVFDSTPLPSTPAAQQP